MAMESSEELCVRLRYNAAVELIKEGVGVFPCTQVERMDAIDKRVLEKFLRNLDTSDRHGCGYGMATLFMELETYIAQGHAKFFTKEYINELHMRFNNYLGWIDSPEQVDGKEEDCTFVHGLVAYEFGEVEHICYEHLTMHLCNTYISRILKSIM
jgi:hypothetical protein